MLRRSQTEINIYEPLDTFLQIPRTISLIELLGERVKRNCTGMREGMFENKKRRFREYRLRRGSWAELELSALSGSPRIAGTRFSRHKSGFCCHTNSHELYPPRARMATGRVIYCGPPSGFMTSPYVSMTKAHMVALIARRTYWREILQSSNKGR